MSLYSVVASKLWRPYDKGAAIVTSDYVRQRIAQIPVLAGAHVSLKDGQYTALQPGLLREFLEDKVWTVGRRYSADLFDCDDFAACARADILCAGQDCGFKRSLCAAEACFEQAKPGPNHAANIVFDAAGNFLAYEPQNGRVTYDLPSVIKRAYEIWG